MHIYRLSNALARRGHTVDVICDQDAYHVLHPDPPPGTFPNEPGVTLHALKSRAGFLSSLATQQTGMPYFKRKKIQTILDTHPPDVTHFHNVSLIGGPGVLFMGCGVKIYTTHEHWLVCPMHVLWKFNREACEERDCMRCQIQGKRPPQWWRYTRLLERAVKEIDLFLSPSRFTLERHLNWGGMKIPMRELPYYYNPPEGAEEVGAATVDTSGSVWPRRYFLFVGRLEKIKGVQNILPAFRKHTDADLLIAGEGDYGNELRSLAQGIENVHFLGRKNQAELTALYREAVALIVPSICYEVFGIIMIESFAHKTPVIAHHYGVLPEVVEQSGGGFTYKNEEELIDAMRLLQSDPEQRRRLGEQGYDCYQRKWSEPAHLEEYLKIVEELLANKAAA